MIPIIVTDWESYYDGEYSLSKIPTEEYIRCNKFEPIGVGIMMPDEQVATWYYDDMIERKLKSIDWSQYAVLCHNGYFDHAINAWRYGIHPKLLLDTMCMAQPLFGFTTGVSLSSLARVLGCGEKGDEVIRAIGKHRHDFTPEEFAAYGRYCCNDTLLCKRIFEKLLPMTPKRELAIIDEVLRCYTDPRLVLDRAMLEEYHQHVVDTKQTHYEWAALQLGCEAEEVKANVMSNPKFAALLEELGVDPPMKISPATGQPTFAFAKGDDEFIALKDHWDERVQAIMECRLGGKSTQAETRAKLFLDIETRGPLPAFFKYYAAHPGRLGGGDDTNLQNLRRGSKLRDAILAPPGHTIVSGDLSQIEARILAVLAGQQDVVHAFRAFDDGTGPDIYCVTATSFLNRVITPADKEERRLGKVIRLALGYGMGIPKFIVTARRDGVRLTLQQATMAHTWFRTTNEYIKRLWKAGDTALSKLYAGEEYTFGVDGCIVVKADGIHLPSGRILRYPGLERSPGQFGPGSFEWTYLNRKKQVKIYGAKVIENICQSLAGSVCNDAWLRLRGHMKIVLQIHDELAGVIHESLAEQGCIMMNHALSSPVPWLPQLPVGCEVGHARRFGDIKKERMR